LHALRRTSGANAHVGGTRAADVGRIGLEHDRALGELTELEPSLGIADRHPGELRPHGEVRGNRVLPDARARDRIAPRIDDHALDDTLLRELEARHLEGTPAAPLLYDQVTHLRRVSLGAHADARGARRDLGDCERPVPPCPAVSNAGLRVEDDLGAFY